MESRVTPSRDLKNSFRRWLYVSHVPWTQPSTRRLSRKPSSIFVGSLRPSLFDFLEFPPFFWGSLRLREAESPGVFCPKTIHFGWSLAVLNLTAARPGLEPGRRDPKASVLKPSKTSSPCPTSPLKSRTKYGEKCSKLEPIAAQVGKG